jgi:hypothetical protein
MPYRIGTKAHHQRYHPWQIKCNSCPRWFKTKAGLSKHYDAYHVAPKAMHSESPISRGVQLEPESTPPYTPPLDDRSVWDVHDDGFPSQLAESPRLNLSPSPTPSQPSFGHADIVTHGELYGAFFLALVLSD